MVLWTVTFGEPLLSGITRKVRKLTLLSGSRYFQELLERSVN